MTTLSCMASLDVSFIADNTGAGGSVDFGDGTATAISHGTQAIKSGSLSIDACFKFDLSGIPATAVIDTASLFIYQASADSGAGTGQTAIIRRNTQTFIESSSATAPAYDRATNWGTLAVGASVGFRSSDLTALVRAWQAGTYTNHGITVENREDDASTLKARTYAARESANDAYISVVYHLPAQTLQMVV